MERSVEAMKVFENVTRCQFLHAGVRSGNILSGHPPLSRLCLSYFIYGVMAMALMAGGDLAPLLVDLIPCSERRQGSSNDDDFNDDLGNVSIDP